MGEHGEGLREAATLLMSTSSVCVSAEPPSKHNQRRHYYVSRVIFNLFIIFAVVVNSALSPVVSAIAGIINVNLIGHFMRD